MFAVGIPDSSPVAVLNCAQLGAFLMLKVSVALVGPDTLGRNAYCCCALITVVGVPVIESSLAVSPLEVVLALAVEPGPAVEPAPQALNRAVTSKTGTKDT